MKADMTSFFYPFLYKILKDNFFNLRIVYLQRQRQGARGHKPICSDD